MKTILDVDGIPEPRCLPEGPDAATLAAWVADASTRTCELLDACADDQLLGPQLATLNPPLWEIGHVGWFNEWWVLRHALGQPGDLANADALYNSSAVAHADRWSLPLPDRDATRRYLTRTRDRILERLAGPALSSRERYFVLLAVFHEDMHAEALAWARQTLGHPRPAFVRDEVDELPPGDLELGGSLTLGCPDERAFAFDNERPARQVEVAPFAIARRPVSDGELLAFVTDGGYRRREVWSEAGWRWREEASAEEPRGWRPTEAGWEVQRFGAWSPLVPARTALHLSYYEAEAYARWAGRRLPTEAEWELAAKAGALAGVGRAWEWTRSTFEGYPGFQPDPYVDYAAPWFGDRLVLRGGGGATHPRLIRNTFRNFFEPHRRDVFAGLRTCRA